MYVNEPEIRAFALDISCKTDRPNASKMTVQTGSAIKNTGFKKEVRAPYAEDN